MMFISRLCSVIYWFALTAWISVLVAAAVAAMSAFPVLGDLDLTLSNYPAVDAAQHGTLAAGMVMEPIFAFTDIMQVTAAAVLLLVIVVQLAMGVPRRMRTSNLLRIACIVIAAGIVGYHVFSIAPQMNHELRAYWSAAQAGDMVRAAAHQAAFQTMHPTAERLLQANLWLLLGAIACSAVALGPEARGKASAVSSSSRLERPALARSST